VRDSARVDRTHLGTGHDTNQTSFQRDHRQESPRSWPPAYFRAGTGLAHSSQQASGVHRLKLSPGTTWLKLEMASGPKGEMGNPADRFYTGGAPIDPDRQPPTSGAYFKPSRRRAELRLQLLEER
jgi:hypothetical protein